MDKDLLRVVIIAFGIIVMLGLWIWGAYKNRKATYKSDFYDKRDSLEKVDDSLFINSENEDIDMVPLEPVLDEDIFSTTEYRQTESENESIQAINSDIETNDSKAFVAEQNTYAQATDLSSDSPEQQAPSLRPKQGDDPSDIVVPDIIQFYILALEYEGFSGKKLQKVFKKAQMTYGSTHIYERLDSNRMVEFSIASLEEPGTFPDANQEPFNCPGIIFFLQTKEVENPVKIFDELISTIDFITSELDGVKLDHGKDPLSKSTITHIRNALKQL